MISDHLVEIALAVLRIGIRIEGVLGMKTVQTELVSFQIVLGLLFIPALQLTVTLEDAPL